jgi:hypothetical protein
VDAILLLQHHRYREERKLKVLLLADGREVWSLVASGLTVFFHTEKSGDIYVYWVSFRSKLRPNAP